MSEFILQTILGVILSAIVGGIITALAVLWKQIKAVKVGMQCMLRSQIIAIYNRSVDRGYCPIYERENLMKAEDAYVNLGGNGVVPGLCQKTLALPTEPSEDIE